MSSEPEATDTDEIERHPCPRCLVEPGSPCRSRSGTVAGTYHTGRFTKVARLAKLLRVPTPTDRRPGQLWRPGTPPPIPADTPATDIHVGYARCSHLTGCREGCCQEPQSVAYRLVNALLTRRCGTPDQAQRRKRSVL